MQQRAQFGAGYSLGESWKILDLLGRRDLATDSHALDHRDRQSEAAGMHGGREPGDAGADHDQVEFPHA